MCECDNNNKLSGAIFPSLSDIMSNPGNAPIDIRGACDCITGRAYMDEKGNCTCIDNPLWLNNSNLCPPGYAMPNYGDGPRLMHADICQPISTMQPREPGIRDSPREQPPHPGTLIPTSSNASNVLKSFYAQNPQIVWLGAAGLLWYFLSGK